MWSVLQRDLAEFVTVVKSGTEEAAASVVKAAVRTADSSTPPPPPRGRRAAAELRALRAARDTFAEPVADAERAAFDAFASAFNLVEKSKEVAQVLIACPACLLACLLAASRPASGQRGACALTAAWPVVQLLEEEPAMARIHAELVPDALTAETFWLR